LKKKKQWIFITKVQTKKALTPPNMLAANMPIGPAPGNPKEQSLKN